MAYSNLVVEQVLNGNGLDSLFTVGFTYIQGETSSIIVEYWDYTVPTAPVQVPFLLNTDYSINETPFPATEILLSSPLPTDFKLIIFRQTQPTQVSSFSNGAFPSQSIERALDRALFVSQENRDMLALAILNRRGGPTFTVDQLVAMDNLTNQNQVDIATNVVDIASNLVTINNNTGRIAQNETDIAAINLASSSIQVIPVSSGTVLCANRRIYVAQGSNITFTLPPATLNFKIVIKVEGTKANILVNSADLIDGISSVPLLAVDESLTVVSDGTKWYII